MNSVNLIGRLTADPTIRSNSKGDMCIANFTLAVPRIGSEEADFIRCTAFGKSAEFVEDYFSKGLRVGVSGHILTGSYEREDGSTAYTTDVIVERLDFADAKRNEQEKPKEEERRTSSKSKSYKRR